MYECMTYYRTSSIRTVYWHHCMTCLYAVSPKVEMWASSSRWKRWAHTGQGTESHARQARFDTPSIRVLQDEQLIWCHMSVMEVSSSFVEFTYCISCSDRIWWTPGSSLFLFVSHPRHLKTLISCFTGSSPIQGIEGPCSTKTNQVQLNRHVSSYVCGRAWFCYTTLLLNVVVSFSWYTFLHCIPITPTLPSLANSSCPDNGHRGMSS